MDLQAALFWVLAIFTGLSAIAVVVTPNIVRAAAWLLFTLAGTAGIYFLIGADFVGATQLIIYVGGILVLVVFGVMLTAQGPFITMRVSAAEWVVAAGVGLLLLTVLTFSLLGTFWTVTDKPGLADPQAASSQAAGNSAQLGQAFLGMTEITPSAHLTGVPETIVRSRLGYLLPFEIVSVHLLVVLIGAAYLARAKRRRGGVS